MPTDPLSFLSGGYSQHELYKWAIQQMRSCPRIMIRYTCSHCNHIEQHFFLITPAGWVWIELYDETAATLGAGFEYTNLAPDGSVSNYYYCRVYNELFLDPSQVTVYDWQYLSTLNYMEPWEFIESFYGHKYYHGVPLPFAPSVQYCFPSIPGINPWLLDNIGTSTGQLCELTDFNILWTRPSRPQFMIYHRIHPDSLSALFWANVPQWKEAFDFYVLKHRKFTPNFVNIQEFINKDDAETISNIIKALQAGEKYEDLREIYDPRLLDEAWSEFNRINTGNPQDFGSWASVPGCFTGYVDNLGIYMDVAFSVNQLASKYAGDNYDTQRKYVMVHPLLELEPAWIHATMLTPNHLSQLMSTLGWALSVIPVVGGALAGALQMVNNQYHFALTELQLRNSLVITAMPRMYAFGRNDTNDNYVPPYEEYLADMKRWFERNGWIFQGGATVTGPISNPSDHPYDYGDQQHTNPPGWKVVPLAREVYNAFVQKVQTNTGTYL